MAKRKPNGDDMRLFSFNVSDGALERFREVAAADHRTVAAELRRLIEQRIAESELQEKAA